MVENAVNEVFVAKMPFKVSSSNPEYGKDLKHTNILPMLESKKILSIWPDEELDISIAPGTEFKLEDTLTEPKTFGCMVPSSSMMSELIILNLSNKLFRFEKLKSKNTA